MRATPPAGYRATRPPIDCCRQRLAAYAYPRVLEIVDELLKTLSGKSGSQTRGRTDD